MIYTIASSSHHVDDLSCQERTVFATDDKEKVLSRFNALRRFCEETKDQEKWCYEYKLFAWEDCEKPLLVEEIKNY